MKVGFIGCGNMGGALVRAAIKTVNTWQVAITDKDIKKAEAFAEETGVIYETLPELIDDLKRKGYGLFVLSDYPECFEHVWESFADFFANFDGRAVSYELHWRKREKKAFPLMLERYGLKAEECFFVDDLYLNTDAAKECGLGAHLFTATENLRAELCELGVL